MRILLNIYIPHEPFNAAVRDGTAGQKLGRIVDEIKRNREEVGIVAMVPWRRYIRSSGTSSSALMVFNWPSRRTVAQMAG